MEMSQNRFIFWKYNETGVTYYQFSYYVTNRAGRLMKIPVFGTRSYVGLISMYVNSPESQIYIKDLP